MNNKQNKIDFVVTWVNSNDENWIKKKEMYQIKINPIKGLNSLSRYRDYDIFKYWFRTVDKYAPWVNKVYLITDHQTPKWLDIDNEKLVCLNHEDYIRNEYLPTYNSNVIELNLDKVNELSENFVLFNDDTFINNFVKPSDFFRGRYPVDTYIESPIMSTNGSVANMMVNDMRIINDNFSKTEFYKNNWKKVFNPAIGKKIIRTIALLPSKKFSGMWNSHLPVSYKKSTFKEIWKLFPEEMNETSSHKFREASDYSQWLMRYWQLASGNYTLQKRNFGKVYDLGIATNDELSKEIIYNKHKMICLNDTDNVQDFPRVKMELINLLSKKYPQKSKFEI